MLMTGQDQEKAVISELFKKHTRKSQQHPQGAIVEREGTIHISNVMKSEHVEQPTATAS